MNTEDTTPLEPDEAFSNEDKIHDILPVSGMYENWFLEYASYVILERAVPAIEDGLKPVQRRIMHAMKEMDDGRYNKVANIIGSTMQYHPHGDASIGDAVVNMGQKDLLIDTQGNWGDVRTGDGAAAPRYIEARLSKFALDVLFNADTTLWQLSYDGRKREPVSLPSKFPLLLAQGVEGIAVGLATKVMPHNFCELILASIDVLKKKPVTIYPDFATGGMIDVTNYNEGKKGGKIRVRAKIEELDKKTLIIKDIPFGTTTTTLIDSIIKANDNGKIKIKKVIDNTAKDVEIQIQLVPGVSPDITIDALYAFTDCEVSISPNACVIIADKPHFISVVDILKTCTQNTLILLQRELEIKKLDLMEKLLFSSLEKIFIQEEMYIDFKKYSDKITLFQYLDERFEKHKKNFYRAIMDEDFEKLTQIPMIRITRFDTNKADEKMRDLEGVLAETIHHLAHLIDYAIKYFQDLLKKYGVGRERKTEIRNFETISATTVALANTKLYVNRAEGFMGTSLKKDEFVTDCSDIDDIIVFRRDGKCTVYKIGEKVFAGKDIIHIGVFRKGDERMVYNMVYLDGDAGISMVKRFQVTGVTREKEYDLTKGSKGSKVLYFSHNPNGEAEQINITLTPACKAKIKVFDFDFSNIEIKGRGSNGNILTKYPVKKIQFKRAGTSTLEGVKIYYDDSIGRLNVDNRGKYLGVFDGDDKLICFYKSGSYEITSFELTNRYDINDVLAIEKLDLAKIISAIYFDGDSKAYFVKRFKLETSTVGKKFQFISEHPDSRLLLTSTQESTEVKFEFAKSKNTTIPNQTFVLEDVEEIKGWKAIGTKLTMHKVSHIELVESVMEEAVVVLPEEPETSDEKNIKVEVPTQPKTQPPLTTFTTGNTVHLEVTPKKPMGNNEQLGLF